MVRSGYAMAKKMKTSRLTRELLETAGEMRVVGLLNRAAYEKITMRHLELMDVLEILQN